MKNQFNKLLLTFLSVTIVLFLFVFNAFAANDFSIKGYVMNVHKPDDSMSTYFHVDIGSDFTGTLPDDVDTITVTGPSGLLSYTKKDFTYLPQFREFYLVIPGSPELGEYTFTVVSGTSSGTDTDTQSVNRTLPVPDTSTFSPADGVTLTSFTPTLSWDPVDYLEVPIYYRLEVWDVSSDQRVFATDRQQGLLSSTIPEGVLSPGQTYRWRVRGVDSSDYAAIQNRSHSDWLTFTTPSTYDATGTWTYSTSNNWVNPGTADCDAQADETGTATVTQTGNSVTIVTDGTTFTGSVAGATYTLSASWSEDGGAVTSSLTFTLSSSTSGSGSVTWSWTDGTYSCNGGSDISLTEQAAQPTGGGGDGDDGGGGCFIAVINGD